MSKWYSFEELKRARTPMPLDSVTGLPDNHVITVVERVISVDNSELIQNNVRTDTVTLDLDAEYDDLNVIIIFTKPNNINVQVAYSGQPVHIPGSVMELTGSVAVSVVGLDAEGETRAVTKAAPDTFQVVASGAYTRRISQDDADLLGQILQAVSDTETAIAEAETATTAATNATSQATSAATSANQAALSANSAASSANSAATKANSAAVDAQNAYDTLQPYMATIDSCANVLHREVGPDSVVTADDSFPCKPVEMVVYGNTVQNLWVNPNVTNDGVTVTSNSDGSMSLSGTRTNMSTSNSSADVYILKPGVQYTVSVDKAIAITSGTGTPLLSIYIYSGDGELLSFYDFGGASGQLSRVFTTPATTAYASFKVYVPLGVTVSGTYRVMLNEGSEAQPWCPPGLNSVGDGGSVDIVTAGKNLIGRTKTAINQGVTFHPTDDGGISVTGTNTGSGAPIAWLHIAGMNSPQAWGDIEYTPIPSGNYTLSFDGPVGLQARITVYSSRGVNHQEVTVYSGHTSESFTLPDSYYCLAARVVASESSENNGTAYIQLEKGSTATDFEPYKCETTSIDLQGHTLNALPDGTRDELHIDGGGNVVLEKRTQTVQLDGDSSWARNETPYVCYISAWSNFGGSPSGYTGENYYVDKLPASSAVANGLYSANTNGNAAYLREPTFASDAAGVKTWMGANKPVVIMRLLEPQTIDLGTITPPTMAAPNVTAYVADDTPAEIELDYVRDINIVVDRLEKKVADLVVTEATIV